MWLNSSNDLLVKVRLSAFLNQYSFHYLSPLTPSVQLVCECVMMHSVCLCVEGVRRCSYLVHTENVHMHSSFHKCPHSDSWVRVRVRGLAVMVSVRVRSWEMN